MGFQRTFQSLFLKLFPSFDRLIHSLKKEDIAQLLTRQVKEPVRFYESIAVMQEAGVTNFIEIGPGKVLSGFVKKIDKTAQLANVEDQASLEALLENE